MIVGTLKNWTPLDRESVVDYGISDTIWEIHSWPARGRARCPARAADSLGSSFETCSRLILKASPSPPTRFLVVFGPLARGDELV